MAEPPRYALRYAPSVRRTLDEIHGYIRDQGAPRAAAAMQARLLSAIEALETFPAQGRSIGGNLRELTTVPPYLIRYRVYQRVVVVTRIRHGARRPD